MAQNYSSLSSFVRLGRQKKLKIGLIGDEHAYGLAHGFRSLGLTVLLEPGCESATNTRNLAKFIEEHLAHTEISAVDVLFVVIGSHDHAVDAAKLLKLHGTLEQLQSAPVVWVGPPYASMGPKLMQSARISAEQKRVVGLPWIDSQRRTLLLERLPDGSTYTGHAYARWAEYLLDSLGQWDWRRWLLRGLRLGV